MRAFFAKEFMPSIHYSSFGGGLGLNEGRGGGVGRRGAAWLPRPDPELLTGVEAAIQRALDEGWSMVLEGVHLVPG